MSFFPRSLITHDAHSDQESYHPLFRLFDELDHYGPRNRTTTMKSFTPKFDVKEVGDLYELHGELPGIEQKDIEIEFTDAQTLTIKGRTERAYSSGTPPAGAIEEGSKPAAITHDKEHQPRVEDVNEEANVTPANNNKAVETATPKKGEQESKDNEARYWVSERSVGEFARSFTFPVRVDQDQVKASMKNGVLSVVVPKSKKLPTRKISIN